VRERAIAELARGQNVFHNLEILGHHPSRRATGLPTRVSTVTVTIHLTLSVAWPAALLPDIGR
jgi:hypothetical protein